LDAKVRFWIIVVVEERGVGLNVGFCPSEVLVYRKDVRGWKGGIRVEGMDVLDGWLDRVIILVVVDMFLFKGWKNVEVVNLALMADADIDTDIGIDTDGVKDEATIVGAEVVIISMALFPLLWLSPVISFVVQEPMVLVK